MSCKCWCTRLTILIIVLVMPRWVLAFQPPQILFNKAKNKIENNDVEEALNLLKVIAREFPGSVWEYRASFLLGKICYDMENYPDSQRWFYRISQEEYILQDYVHYLLGKIFLEEKNYAKAIFHFTRIVGSYPDSLFRGDSSFLIAESFYNLEDYKRAADYYRNFIKKFPGFKNFDEAYFKLGKSLEKNNRRWEALMVYREILLNYPESKFFSKIRKRIKKLSGKPSENLFPNDLDTDMARVDRLLEKNKFSRAMFILVNQMLPRAPKMKNAEIYLKIGVCKFQLRKYNDAIKTFEKVISIGRGKTAQFAHYYLSRIYYRKDKERKFVKHSKWLLVSNENLEFMDKVLYNLGRFYENRNKFKEASGYWKKLTDGYAGSNLCDDALWHLAWNTYCRKKYTRTLEAMENIEEKYPGSEFIPRILYWKGRIYEIKKRYLEAYRSYHRVYHFFPYTYYGIIGYKRLTALTRKKPKLPKKTGGVEYITDDNYRLDPKLLQPENHLSIMETVHYEKGNELLLLGLKESAIAEFNAFETGTDLDFSMKFHVADLYMRSGDYYRGIRILRKIVTDKRIYGKKIIPEEISNKFFPHKFNNLILQYSEKNGLDPYLVAGLILQESAFNPRARSYVGATGLMQLMPTTAKWLMRVTRLGKHKKNRRTKLYDPQFNIALGTRYLKMLMDAFPRKEYLAVASYNAGKKNVEKWLKGFRYNQKDEFIELIPFNETEHFVKAVLRNKHVFMKQKIFEK